MMDNTTAKQPRQLITNPEPLTVRTKRAAAMCDVSPRKWAEMESCGKVPPSYKLGGCKIWKTEHLRLWTDWNFPNLDRFQQLMEARK